MIRKMNGADIPVVMEIWLETNIKTHDFISSEYWRKNYAAVGQMMQDAEIYVCEKHGEIEGFVKVKEQIEEENQEWEYEMRWRHDGC